MMAVTIETVLAPWRYWPLTKPRLSRNRVARRLVDGDGYLAGTFPDGITTVEGVPVAATVRVLLRSVDPALDGVVLAQVKSAPDGTWRVDGLNPALKYDVVGRKDGYNDVIMANVSPATDKTGREND